jgi:hypothetical protein
LLIDYPHHRRWLQFTGGALLLAAGSYGGLTAGPATASPPYALLAVGFLGAALLCGLLRWLAWRHMAWRGDLLVSLLGGTGFFYLGLLLGRRWAIPGGPTAASVAGLWYGILAAACMVFAGLLAALRHLPSWWWLGSRQWWLKGHIWLGLLSVIVVLFHSTFRLGGLLEQALWLVLILLIASGVFGLALQHVVPRLLTLRVPGEVPYEQIPHECLLLRGKADNLVDALCGPEDVDAADAPQKADASVDPLSRKALRNTYEALVRPFLGPEYRSDSPLARAAQAEVVFRGLRSLPGLAGEPVAQLERFCRDRREMGEQERLHHWLHLWLLAHIPLSVLLLALGVVHVVTAVFYY